MTPAGSPSDPPPALPAADSSELASFLRARGVDRVVVVGLAGDYCVSATAVSAADHGFKTAVLLSGTRSISDEKAGECWENLREKGGEVIEDEGALEVWLR